MGKGNDTLKRKDYEEELEKLHVELVNLQEWTRLRGLKVCVLFEGRDGAGKGGVIKAITERVSPRVFRVVALPAPTEREKSQMYAQRYIRHLPAAGEIVIWSPGGADEAAHGTDRRRPQDLEALAHGSQVLQPVVRLLASPRRDVRGHRHRVGALVRRPLGRQAPRAARALSACSSCCCSAAWACSCFLSR